MESNSAKIIDEGTVQLSVSVDGGVLTFKVTEYKDTKKFEFVGRIFVLSDFQKLKENFNNINEVFEFLKETKNAKIDFQRPSVTLFYSLGTKKLIEIADVPLKKVSENKYSPDYKENYFQGNISLDEIINLCGCAQEINNGQIKQCLRSIVEEVTEIKKERQGGDRVTKNVEGNEGIFGDMSSEIKKEIEIFNEKIGTRFTELERSLEKNILEENVKAKTQSFELFEKSMKEVAIFKEQFQKELEKRQSTDEYISMIITEKLASVKKELETEISSIKKEQKGELLKMKKEIEEIIKKQSSKVDEIQGKITENSCIMTLFLQEWKKWIKEKKKIQKIENCDNKKEEKRIKVFKFPPEYDEFNYIEDENKVVLVDSDENYSSYFFIPHRIVENNFEFEVKIVTMKKRSIEFGVVDYQEYMNTQEGIIDGYNEASFRCDGNRYPANQSINKTITQGQNVVIRVDTINGIIKFLVDGKELTSCRESFLKEKKRKLYAFIGLKYEGDAVKFSY